MATILIVDDHPAMAGAVAALVRTDGHEPVVTLGGQAALDTIRTRPVDLVILDAMMPGMSGLDVLSALRDDPDPAHHPPVVMYSGNDQSRQASLQLGAVDYVLKTDAHKLLDVINAHVNHVVP